MTFKSLFPLLFALTAYLNAQSPDLLPGESLALINQTGEVQTWGDVDTISPMGNMAKLLWLRLEAAEWETYGIETRCKGEINGIRCSVPKGHGRVNLAKSFKEDCNAAFGVWANVSRQRMKKDFGDGGARHRMIQVFGPFLASRLPASPPLPPTFGTEWFADGQLLQASPAQLANWLANPSQERVLRLCRSYILGFTDFVAGKKETWWIKTSEAPTPDDKQKYVWVLGGNGSTTALMRVPPGLTPKEAEARFRALLNIKGR